MLNVRKITQFQVNFSKTMAWNEDYKSILYVMKEKFSLEVTVTPKVILSSPPTVTICT